MAGQMKERQIEWMKDECRDDDKRMTGCKVDSVDTVDGWIDDRWMEEWKMDEQLMCGWMAWLITDNWWMDVWLRAGWTESTHTQSVLSIDGINSYLTSSTLTNCFVKIPIFMAWLKQVLKPLLIQRHWTKSPSTSRHCKLHSWRWMKNIEAEHLVADTVIFFDP